MNRRIEKEAAFRVSYPQMVRVHFFLHGLGEYGRQSLPDEMFDEVILGSCVFN
jgi:hypothetical protein